MQPRTVVLYNDFPATSQGQQNVEIRPKVDGFVEAICVDEGAAVRKGQPLFHISAPQYEEAVRTAQAGIQTSVANVNSARMGVEKLRPLVNKDIIGPYARHQRGAVHAARSGGGPGPGHATPTPVPARATPAS